MIREPFGSCGDVRLAVLGGFMVEDGGAKEAGGVGA